MSEDIKQMKTHNKGNLLINHSSMLYIFNTKEFMLEFIEYVTNLQNKLQQKENIIKKVREYIIQYGNLYCLKHKQFKDYHQYKVILQILDKVEENK